MSVSQGKHALQTLYVPAPILPLHVANKAYVDQGPGTPGTATGITDTSDANLGSANMEFAVLRVGADGERIVVTDLEMKSGTTGSGVFQIIMMGSLDADPPTSTPLQIVAKGIETAFATSTTHKVKAAGMVIRGGQLYLVGIAKSASQRWRVLASQPLIDRVMGWTIGQTQESIKTPVYAASTGLVHVKVYFTILN